MSNRRHRQHVFQRQIDRLQRRLTHLKRVSDAFVTARLIIFILLFVGTAAALFLSGPTAVAIEFPIMFVAFVVTVILHRRVETAIDRFQHLQTVYRHHLARQNHQWDDLPPFETDPRTHNALEIDFDLPGDYGLLRLLNTAVAPGGQKRLRHWLAEPPTDPAVTNARQTAVRQLVPLVTFRHKLIVAARQTAEKPGWTTEKLLEWVNQNQTEPTREWVALLFAMAVSNIVLFTLFTLGVIGAWWQITLIVYVLLSLFKLRTLSTGADGRSTADTFTAAAQIRDALAQLMAVLGHVEQQSFPTAPAIADLCAPIHRQTPSMRLRALNRIINATAVGRNPFLGFALNLLLPWNFYFAYRLNLVRADLADRLPLWLDVWAELDALNSLATFAYLHPEYTFPTITAGHEDGSADTDPVFTAEQLGHPLIPHAQRVPNDFTVESLDSIALITGSNMAGKSSFLRTVGLGLILAFAGGPVDAVRFESRPFRLFSAIRITDSVTDGISYFYAEVKRLRAMLGALQAETDPPLFFFVDEIFRGTNNRERLIGSGAYIRALVGHNGVGLISTHDLELVALADELPQLQNYHFRDFVTDGRMTFDYTLRPGPSPTTNALKIMALEGLPIPADERA